MPRNRKVLLNHSVSMITTRTEEGLPLMPCLLINFMLRSVIAKAQSMYPVKACHYMFMANHFHMIIVTENPECVSQFVGYIKRESAWFINIFLGRTKHTVWCEGFDEAKLLTVEDVMRYVVYLYTNPVNAKLVSTIDQYPGISSWQWFTKGINHGRYINYSRADIERLSSAAPSVLEQREIIRLLTKKSHSKSLFSLEPWAWVSCFPGLKKVDLGSLKREIIRLVHAEEASIKKNSTQFLGPEAIKLQPLDMAYAPKKQGRRMICLCSDVALRKAFLAWYRTESARAKRAIKEFRLSGKLVDMPPGFYLPGGSIYANMLGFPDLGLP